MPIHLIKPVNWILATDSYKVSHWLEIPEGTKYTWLMSMPRKVSPYSDVIVAMGQSFNADILSKIRIEQWMIEEAEYETRIQGFSFNRKGWQIIADEFDGILPIRMYGVPEGLQVTPNIPIAAYINSDERFAWLPGYFEPILLRPHWKMSTVATMCLAARKILTEYADKTGTAREKVNYMYHFFGDRAADSYGAAVKAGIAHAALFDGTDCLSANRYIKSLFGDPRDYMSSIEATEHFVSSLNSDNAAQDDFGAAEMAVDRLYKVVELAKQGIGISKLSVVIDTFNDIRFVRDYIGDRLKDRILNSGGTLVCRPDTGNPSERPGVIGELLANSFGTTETATRHRVLHPCVEVIQGDGINIDSLRSVVSGWVDDNGFAMDSFHLGSGNGISHEGSRDDFSFSMKAIAYFDHKWNRLLKAPKGDSVKKSLTGLLGVVMKDGRLDTVDYTDRSAIMTNDYWLEWQDTGVRKVYQNFGSVRSYARAGT